MNTIIISKIVPFKFFYRIDQLIDIYISIPYGLAKGKKKEKKQAKN